MNYLAILLFFLLNIVASAQPADLKDMRKKYAEAVKDVGKSEKFYNEMVSKKSDDALNLAYMGASEALMAKNVKSLPKKMSFLKSYESSFNRATTKDPENIEIRFLRFGINSNLPSFLKDKDNLESDKKIIIKNLNKSLSYSIINHFRNEIIKFLLDSKKCTAEEEKNLNSFKFENVYLLTLACVYSNFSPFMFF